MLSDFRKQRIGITDAARLLGVSVSELKGAIQGEKLLRGVSLPKVIYCGTGNYQFHAGEIMDCAENLKAN